MKNITTCLLILIFLAFTGQSCTDDFEEINTNPNSPVQAPITNVLGYVLTDFNMNYFGVIGDMNEPSTYAGQLGKLQYIDDSRYMFTSTNINTLWTVIYRDLKNAQAIIDQADKTGSKNMKATGLTLQAFILQIATDRWRDVPFTEAFKGDAGFITPKYDTQETIYPAIITQLKTAADLFAAGGTDVLGEGDLLYGGDVKKWQKLCNSLRLRVAIRISNVSPATAKPIIEEIASAPTTYPILAANTDNALLKWTGSSPYIEPWNSNFMTRDDHGPSNILINSLKQLKDPRLAVYAKPAPVDGEYRGVEIGPPTSPVISNYSRIGVKFREDPTGFSPMMRYSEVLFILAEAKQKGWNSGSSTAETLYNAGVTASLNENGITDGTVISTYLAGSDVKWDNTTTKLYTQKWLSLYKNGNEAWAESRRTDIPLMPAATGSPFTGHTRPPFRYPYPPTETTLNAGNSASFIAEIKDNFWGKKMWWDTRTVTN
ncbi:SusD/RagB family nutrient-binding outer membrane lipoprotein [Dyadobacter sp. 3J3]|uniref:SusD/RagB family nutrient-binding outer membrane lipoprotein n=1 Tax=Dyadobacter sp. 3J3 TaxID=2606600 RepID=UPI001356E253|nr:SusD/RagB family nutrient-binding outer membrane lipoprotein [Dyadobacter sp. 3J3]